MRRNPSPISGGTFPAEVISNCIVGAMSSEIRFTVSAGDPDEEALTYSAISPLPKGAKFLSSSGTFIWTPGSDQAGD